MDFAEVMDSPEMTDLLMEMLNNPANKETMSAFCAGTGGIVEALRTSEKVVERLMKIEPNPGEAKRLREEGNKLFMKGKYEEAAKKYTAAMRFALDPALYCNRAAAHHGMKDYYKAIRDCRATLRIDAGYVKAYVRMGLAFTCLENHKEAVECHKNAIEMQPREQIHKDRLKEAEEMLQKQRANPMSGIKSSVPHDALGAKERQAMMEATHMMGKDPKYRDKMSRFVSIGDIAGFKTLFEDFMQDLTKTNPEKALEFIKCYSKPA